MIEEKKFYFNFFKEIYPNFPEGGILDNRKKKSPFNKPDFSVKTKDGIIGREMTNIFRNTSLDNFSLKQVEAERIKILDNARKICEKDKVPPLIVDVFFNFSTVRNKRSNIVAEALAKLVKNNCPDPEKGFEAINEYENTLNLPEEIYSVRIFRTIILTQHFWSAPEANFVQTDFVKELQWRIDEKNKKFPEYIKNCDQCWLIIYATGLAPSSFFFISDETKNHIYPSRFDKSIYMEVVNHKVVELITKS